ncbi:uncharacterized protein LOC114879456 [Osmia bicornis bicornis]|uniref:uncharacterized protein LOC114879456 n=1 Tax=Osmia bicornis bicornis TaxID=1437191 RepID=UPI001EAED852|nr:uncharacterized protein LOC114879456 [Osmia bicornis bicornis]
MQSSIPKLLLVSVLCVIPYVKAENKVTVVDFKADVPGNDIVDSWSHDLTNNLISSNINIKKNCPGAIEAEIKVYQGDNLVNQMVQNLKQPIKDFESYQICESIDSPDLEDDSCSIAEGEQSAKNCDISGWFSDMSPGDYKVECSFKQADVITTLTLNVKIESG